MRRLRVKEVAQARGFTIARLERTAGIDIKTVRAIWHNPRHNASFDTLEKIAAAIGVSVTSLIEDDNFPTVSESTFGSLDEITRNLRELDRVVRDAGKDPAKHPIEPPPDSMHVQAPPDEIERAMSRLQALLPNSLKVVYIQEYHANGIFAADTSAPSSSPDINYPLP